MATWADIVNTTSRSYRGFLWDRWGIHFLGSSPQETSTRPRHWGPSTTFGDPRGVVLSATPDRRIWTGDGIGSFSCSSFYSVLLREANSLPLFPVSWVLWRAKAPFKMRVFSWLVAWDKLNTCDNLQRRRAYKALSPHVYILCFKDGESGDHLFLHCDVARFLWSSLFGVTGESWVCLRTVRDFLLMQAYGFGGQRDRRILWRNGILWVIWSERNWRIFKEQRQSWGVLWDKVLFLAFLWTQAEEVHSLWPQRSSKKLEGGD